jgi:hypothetical protein
MGDSGDCTSSRHGIQKFLLIRARVFARKFDFEVYSSTIPDTVAENVSLAMMTNVHDTAVFRVELTYRMVTSHAAVFTQSYDDLVLQLGFGVNNRPPPW